MMKLNYTIAKMLCPVLPPIVSQRVRAALIKLADGAVIDRTFKKRSFTGSFFRGSTTDFHAFKFSVHGYFDWRNIIIANEVLKAKAGHIIEVGANIGTETISFSDITAKHKKQVFAFEPLASNYRILFDNIAFNDLKNVRLFQCLVSDSNGRSYFKIPAANDSGSGHIADSSEEGVEEIDVVTLDATIKEEPISLISIDVEGFEYHVIKGATKITAKNQPVYIVEVNRNYLEKRAGITVNEFYDFFRNNNYGCYYVNTFGLEAVNISNFKIKPNKNWVCIPNSQNDLASAISTAIKINALNPLFSYFYF
ncbi:MAG TPA: FkbM family methyltransferase [Flavobacterium sp.]|jgi:FkbM family methyltransferase